MDTGSAAGRAYCLSYAWDDESRQDKQAECIRWDRHVVMGLGGCQPSIMSTLNA